MLRPTTTEPSVAGFILKFVHTARTLSPNAQLHPSSRFYQGAKRASLAGVSGSTKASIVAEVSRISA